MQWAWIVIIGLFAGILSGFAGVGGGVTIVPAMVALGYGQKLAQGTTLAMLMTPVVFLAVYNYYKEGQVDFKLAGILAIGFVVGSFFGSKLALYLDPNQLKKIFGWVLLAVAIKMILGK